MDVYVCNSCGEIVDEKERWNHLRNDHPDKSPKIFDGKEKTQNRILEKAYTCVSLANETGDQKHMNDINKTTQEQTDASDKKVQRVVVGPVKTKKKNDAQKIADIFISEDVKNVKSYVIMDVLVPAIKKAISDIVTNGTDMILYGESGRARKNGTASKISYNSIYDRGQRRETPRIRTGYDYDDVILSSRGEAEEVLMRMDELISAYGIVSVADYFDLVGVTGNYTDNKYGWTDIRNASVIRVRDGYMIKMPRAIPLD